ncbi:MAG: heat-inducible transcriptional repressor HrcA [Lachnospiraceae bacterium]|nr:heat-inducible transcriptional repressor HrcA [Lachnospiraceae bacterium]
MELAQRKVKILKAIVEAYIKTGDPIGSKALCSALDFPVSSATVRNEMAELAELGLLIQPHTSAGRIPSQAGYRLYVNELMERRTLPNEFKLYIIGALEEADDDPEKILRRSSEVIAELCHITAITTAPSSATARIRHLRFVQTGRQTCMVVLITSTGLIKNRLFKCDYVITPEIIRIFEESLNRKLAGLPIVNVTPAFMQTLAVEFGELAMLIPSVLAAIMEACFDMNNISLAVSGRLNLAFDDEHDPITARELLRLLNSNDELESVVMSLMPESRILIGSEIGHKALESFCVITEPYSLDNASGGMLAAIAPQRTDYAFLTAVMEYTSECVSKLICELIS